MSVVDLEDDPAHLSKSIESTESKKKYFKPAALALVDVALTASTLAVALGIVFGIVALADKGFLDALKLKSVLSGICPFSSMLLFISPIPVVLDALVQRDVENFPTPVFKAQAACNLLTVAYGIQIQNKVIVGNNMCGLACQTLYLASDHYVRSDNGRWLAYSVQLQAIYAVALYVCMEILPVPILGHVICLGNVILFAVPLVKLKFILQTRNASSLPVAMTVACAGCNSLWTVYGLLISDLVVLIPCMLGYTLGLFQLLVILWCANKLPYDLGFLLLPCSGSQPAVEDTGDASNDVAADNSPVLRRKAELARSIGNPADDLLRRKNFDANAAADDTDADGIR